MTLPHPDRSLESPWESWPVHIPEPAAARTIERVDDEVRNLYRVTMPNGATAECWTVINSWDGDEEYGSTGDWTPYGLHYNAEHEFLDGGGSAEVFECLEQWLRQDRGNPCDTCRCSGRVPAFLFLPVYDSWQTCPTCLGLAWIPHPPEDLQGPAA
jgi:hypothetical protein